MRGIVLIAAVWLMLVCTLWAQPPLPLTNMMDVVAHGTTPRDLELRPEQYAEIRSILRDLRQASRDAIEAGEILAPEDRSIGVRAAIAHAEQEATARLKGVLEPEQFEKLQRITVRSRFERHGIETALKSDDILPSLANLDLDDAALADVSQAANDARREFERKADELTRKYNEEVSKLKAEYTSEVLGLLPDEARGVFAEILAAPHEEGR